MIHPSSVISPDVVMGEGCEIGPFCVVGPGVVMGARNILRNHVTLEGPSSIGSDNVFFPGCAVGTQPQDLKYAGEPTTLTMGDRNIVRECVTINRGTVGGGGHTTVGTGCLFMLAAHVAHDCHVGDGVIMANSATLAGHVTVGEFASIGGLTPVHQFVRIGPHAFIGGATRVSQDIVPFIKMGGIPPTILGANSVGLLRRGFDKRAVEAIDTAVKILFKSGLNTTQGVEKIKASLPAIPEIAAIISFVETSQRGILRG
ncbi:MAG: acyl-ACP--UDP-N-acetylglucosamine O-acyltransferase [Candidatus Hydrogenedentota bacterium]